MNAIENTAPAKNGPRTDLEVISRRVLDLFPNGCRRFLMLNCPQINGGDFDLATAKLRRYPCFPPYGPGLVVNSLKKAGYEVEIMDLNFSILSSVDEPEFSYYCWQKSLSQKIRKFKPEMIGVSCMFSANHGAIKMVIKWVRRNFPNIPIIAGGVHVSTNTDAFLRDVRSADLAMVFESDLAIVNLLDFINDDVEAEELCQLNLLVDDELFSTKKQRPAAELGIDSSPFYGELPIGQYSSFGEIGVYGHFRPEAMGPAKRGTIIANRGCRAACSFCSVRFFNGVGVRSRTPQTVADEIEGQYNRYGINHVMWLDDDLWNGFTLEVLHEIERRALPITWDASNAVIARATTPELLEASYRSGCLGLSFGLESGNPDILRGVHKPSKVEDYLRVGKLVKDYPGMFFKGFTMVGFGGETVGQIWDTIDLFLEVALDWYPVQVVRAFGETEMSKKLKKKVVVDQHTILTQRMYVGPTGSQRQKELGEEYESSFNEKVLDPKDLERVPTNNELADVWFIMDWLLNYRSLMDPIDPLKFNEARANPQKMRLQKLNLQHIIGRLPKRIALAPLFLGIIQQELGEKEEAQENFRKTDKALEASAFWRVRFKKLGINEILNGRRAMK